MQFSSHMQDRLILLSELLKKINAAQEWDNIALQDFFDSTLKDPEELTILESPLLVAAGAASAYRAPVHTGGEVIAYLRKLILARKKWSAFAIFKKTVEQGAGALGCRLSTSRLAEETDIHLWWDDDLFDEKAEVKLNQFFCFFERGVSNLMFPGLGDDDPDQVRVLH